MTPRLKVLLGVLGAALLLALWSALKPEEPASPSRGRAALEEGAAARRAGRGRQTQEEPVLSVVELRLSDLEPKAGEFHPGRNPFAFYVPPAPPPPPAPPGPSPEELEAQRQAAEAARQEAIAAAAAEPAQPTPPPIDVAYLGSFGPPSRRVAVFRNGTGGLINALLGDVLDGKFRLVGIGYESVDLEYVGFPHLPPEQVAVGEEGI